MSGADVPGPDPIAAMRVTGLVPAPRHLGRASIGRWRVGGREAREALERQRAVAPDAEGHPLPAGEHTVLLVDGAFSMSDAPFVLRNYVPFLEAAAGDVLLTGLGLGCLVRGLLARPAVRSVTVLELHAEVVALVAPHHADPRVEIVRADALAWEPPAGRRWDAAMLDLADDRALVERLVDRYAPVVGALWPDPAGMDDAPPAPDVAELLEAARRAVAGPGEARRFPRARRAGGTAPSG